MKRNPCNCECTVLSEVASGDTTVWCCVVVAGERKAVPYDDYGDQV